MEEMVQRMDELRDRPEHETESDEEHHRRHAHEKLLFEQGLPEQIVCEKSAYDKPDEQTAEPEPQMQREEERHNDACRQYENRGQARMQSRGFRIHEPTSEYEERHDHRHESRNDRTVVEYHFFRFFLHICSIPPSGHFMNRCTM